LLICQPDTEGVVLSRDNEPEIKKEEKETSNEYLKAVNEWLKGCSNGEAGECDECTKGLVSRLNQLLNKHN
jgi:hypothetical protein